jgi:hypothetical protein
MAAGVSIRHIVQLLASGEALDEGPGQYRYVFLAATQRRDGDRKDVQAIVEVLAELAILDCRDQILVGGRDQPDIDLERTPSTDRLDFTMLDGTQQFDLNVERQLPDLIEEQSAAVGFDEFAGMLFGGAGKRPFSWPNRMLSTRFCGMAPQLTVMKGLFARSLPDWMARATISLPTPDSPSSTTGMSDWAPRRARSITRVIDGLTATMSPKRIVAGAGLGRCAGCSAAIDL